MPFKIVLVHLAIGLVAVSSMMTAVPPQMPAAGGRIVKSSIHQIHANGSALHLEYEAELADGIVLLDDMSNMLHVLCDANTLLLHINGNATGTLLQWQLDGVRIVTGSHKWNCRNHSSSDEGSPFLITSILRFVNKMRVISHSILALDTTPAGLTDAIRNGVLHFSSNHAQHSSSAHLTVPQQDADHSSGHRRLDRSLFLMDDIYHAASDIESDMESAASDVEQAASDVASGVATALTGHYDKSFDLDSRIINWNFDSDSQQAVEDTAITTGLSCSNCYFNADLTVHAHIVISDYSLSSASAYVQGSVDMHVEGRVSFEYSRSSNGKELIATIPLGFPSIALGPVTMGVSLSMPVYVGYDFSFEAAANGYGIVSANGQMQHGFEYDSADYGIQWISNHNLQRYAALEVDGKLTAQLEVYAMPELQLSVQFIGKATAALKAGLVLTLDASMQAQADGSEQSDFSSAAAQFSADLTATLSYTADVTLSAQLDVSIAGFTAFNRQWGPYSPYSTNGVLFTKSWGVNDTFGPFSHAQSVPNDVNSAYRRLAATSASSFNVPNVCPANTCVKASGLQTCAFLNDFTVCGSSLSALLTIDEFVATEVQTFKSMGSNCTSGLTKFLCYTHMPICAKNGQQPASNVGRKQLVLPMSIDTCTDIMTACVIGPQTVRSVCSSFSSSEAHPVTSMPPQVVSHSNGIDLHAKLGGDVAYKCVRPQNLTRCIQANNRMVAVDAVKFATIYQAESFAYSTASKLITPSDCTEQSCSESILALMCAVTLPECPHNSTASQINTIPPLRLCNSTCTAWATACDGHRSLACDQHSAASGDCGYAQLDSDIALITPDSQTNHKQGHTSDAQSTTSTDRLMYVALGAGGGAAVAIAAVLMVRHFFNRRKRLMDNLATQPSTNHNAPETSTSNADDCTGIEVENVAFAQRRSGRVIAMLNQNEV